MTITSPTMAVTRVYEMPVLALVDVIAGRYRHWLSCERRAETILRRTSVSQNHWHNSTILSHRPYFQIELAFASGPPVLEADDLPESRVLRTIFERLERHESITESTAFRKQASPAAQLAAAETIKARPVERVVQSNRKATVSDVQERDAQKTRQDAAGTPLPKIDWPSPRKDSAALPDAEVGRLADQVIRTIDRRMIAQRERMGRR